MPVVALERSNVRSNVRSKEVVMYDDDERHEKRLAFLSHYDWP